MADFKLTKKAVDDLTRIWNYTLEVWSEEQADKYYKMLISYCEVIANQPELGKEYDKINKNLRGIRANRHIIFYKSTDNNNIEIIRILHGQMDLKKRILE